MNLLDRLERKFGHLAITNLTLYLIGGQIVAFFMSYLSPQYAHITELQGSLIWQGQVWRIVTMLFTPLSRDPLFAAFTWYLYYLYGTQLEAIWGAFRYMVYLLIAYVLTVICSFIFPLQIITNTYIFTSVFLAFAFLNPEFRLAIFFIIPIKIKWLGILAWIGIALSIIFGSIETKVLAIVSVVNFFIFFGYEIRELISDRSKHVAFVQEKNRESQQYFMHCAVCNANESDKKMFSYCKQCQPETMYCEDHIRSHTHRNTAIN